MDRDTALAKIKKCLALSKSAEPHEAAAALRQAQKLMQQFDLGEQDVSLSDVREARVSAASTAANLWEVELVSLCADSMGCEVFARQLGFYNMAGNFVRSREYVFIGLDAAADVAAYAFSVLQRQCVKARKFHIQTQPRQCKPATKTARGDAFARGWVSGVRHLVERFAQPARNEQLLLEYLKAKHPNLKPEKVRNSERGRAQDAGHFGSGHQAGQKAELHRGVGATAAPALLT